MTTSSSVLAWLEAPSITAPVGWSAAAVEAGIKTYGERPRYDVGVLVSDRPCSVGGIFTQNSIPGAPVILSRERVARGAVQAIVINSGCSNVAMGERGLADARRMTEVAAQRLGIDRELVLVGSTGVIGRPLPMDRIEKAIADFDVAANHGPLFSRAMMTTDTVPKCRAVRFTHAGTTYHVAGTAKGSGMAHPNMATVFCFLTTDAKVSSSWLQQATKRVGDQSINMVDVDMDTSTSDMMIIMANGAANGSDLSSDAAGAELLERALLEVSIALAKDLARDGEGAQKLLEATVTGALSVDDARAAARTIVSSPLIKTMVTGCDPNLGRVLMAIGRSGAAIELSKLSVWIGEHRAFENGTPTALDYAVIRQAMQGDTVELRADLGVGAAQAVAWGCDLTKEYVSINADYTT